MGTHRDRRDFLKMAGTAGMAAAPGLAGILASGRAPAFAQGTRLHVLRWSDFIPAGDEVLAKQLEEAGKVLGAQITLERINSNDLQARITAAISSGQGADIAYVFHNWAHLYERGLADVSDVCEDIGRAQGGFYPAMESLCKVGQTWRAVPHAIAGVAMIYRKSMLEDVGVAEFPKTWEQLRDAGKKLKAKGYPIGQAVGHTLGDPPNFWYPYLWSWGGKEVEADGRTVAINSSETVESVRFAVGFWKDACDEGGLAWDDTSNNRAFLAGSIAVTSGGGSIYIVARRDPRFKTDKGMPLADDIRHAPFPGGPAGTYGYHQPQAHVVLGYSKNQKLAKDLLRWLHARERYEQWFAAEAGYVVGPTTEWERHPVWERDPIMTPYRAAVRSFRLFGHAGPPSAKATQAFAKYIVVDLYAKAIQGLAPEEAARWAETELRKIYTV